MRARGQWLDEENRTVDNIYFIYKIYVHNLLLAQSGEKRREEEWVPSGIQLTKKDVEDGRNTGNSISIGRIILYIKYLNCILYIKYIILLKYIDCSETEEYNTGYR